MDSAYQDLDCAICLQKCHHPTQLPCGHIFCFLCVKGIAIQSKKCAMCRMLIPPDYFDNPVILDKSFTEENRISVAEDTYQWYYEGRNGWWKYDERSNSELEAAYSSGDTECLLLLAGAIYCVDFQNMIQVRRSDRTRRRKVRRDIPTLPAKGIAGIKQFDITNQEDTDTSNDINPIIIDDNENEIINVVDEYEDTHSDAVLPQPDEIVDLTRSISNVNIEEETIPRGSPT